MGLAEPRPSDRYNVVQPQQGAKLPSAGGFERGLGAAFSPAGGLDGGSSFSRGLGSLRPSSTEDRQQLHQQEQPASAPAVAEFLVPFGGLDRYYPPPSPVKPALAVRACRCPCTSWGCQL